MLGMLNVMLMIIKISNAGNRFYNDICATVSKSSAYSTVAIVKCHPESVIFDPKSQNGSLYNNYTDSWTGEIFACQCSCILPYPPKNGQILTNGRVRHGKNLEYKCNDGKTNNKIICFDGLLMMIPEFLEDDNIRIAFRQKTLPEHFLYDFHGSVFQLSVNMSDWSVHESEVSNNLKYTDRLNDKDGALIYYLFNGEGFKLGTIDLKRHVNLECDAVYDFTAIIAICGTLAFMVIISTACIILIRCSSPPSDSSDLDENEINAIRMIELIENA